MDSGGIITRTLQSRPSETVFQTAFVLSCRVMAARILPIMG
ncbi:hypothetical protein NEIELOOT_03054 [Neisseria elongata subsp. glycolytica ATCC 29315]|uniref:Uncharacterized protein n=1 Tax=Neisseria elongata subsp. glycolytica ATCC 29315 TaxID=546263 RepID=D4DVD7_NEIEG|nr:hypothetical protein NEIELOOT_03054 [Neisseria elongata subsp. glycolytica ATCC 29315]